MLRILSATLLLTGISLKAQDPNLISTEILTVAVSGDSPNYYFGTENKIFRLAASATGISNPTLYTGPARLALYSEAQHLAPPPEGEEPVPPAAIVSLPREDRVLLLFAADPKDNKKLIVKAFGIDKSSLRGGDYMAYNFSKNPTFLILGHGEEVYSKVKILPKKSAKLSHPKLRSEILDLPVQLGIEKDGAYKVISKKLWGHRNLKRTFLFFFDGPSERQPIDLRRYYDVPGIKVAPSSADEVTLDGKAKKSREE